MCSKSIAMGPSTPRHIQVRILCCKNGAVVPTNGRRVLQLDVATSVDHDEARPVLDVIELLVFADVAAHLRRGAARLGQQSIGLLTIQEKVIKIHFRVG